MNSRLCMVAFLSLTMCSYSFAAAAEGDKTSNETIEQPAPDASEGSYDFVSDRTELKDLEKYPNPFNNPLSSFMRYCSKTTDPETQARISGVCANNIYEVNKTKNRYKAVSEQLNTSKDILPTLESIQKAIERTTIALQAFQMLNAKMTTRTQLYTANSGTSEEHEDTFELLRGSKNFDVVHNGFIGTEYHKVNRRGRNILRKKMLQRVPDELKKHELLALSDEEDDTKNAETQTPSLDQLPTADQPPAAS